jgi:hypothetical protein
MRLLNTRTLELKEFFDEAVPSYAILSHRWDQQELSYRDLKPKHAHTLSSKPGYSKIYNFCKTAFRDGYEWGWCDTTNIDKTSSAELSEAINSMFRWYQNAEVCYVYMETVPSVDPRNVATQSRSQLSSEQYHAFRRSEWHLRGWTLQELLAPDYVVFLDRTWTKFGTKDSLASELAKITGIEERILIDSSRLTLGGQLHDPPSVATKMSWACSRVTSRKEDIAYCLLGIFNINMPLLYGEGDRAFVRLQEEIIRRTDDETIFAWRGNGTQLLASSPAAFVNFFNQQFLGYQVLAPDKNFHRAPYSITNQGLQLHGELIKTSDYAQRYADGNPLERAFDLLPLRISNQDHKDVMSGMFYAIAVRSLDEDKIWSEEIVDAIKLQDGARMSSGDRHMTTFARADTDAFYECHWIKDHSLTITNIVRIPRPAPSSTRQMSTAEREDPAWTDYDMTDKYRLQKRTLWDEAQYRPLYLSLNPGDRNLQYDRHAGGTDYSEAGLSVMDAKMQDVADDQVSTLWEPSHSRQPVRHSSVSDVNDAWLGENSREHRHRRRS